MVYLDNGATTFPKPECVYTAMDAFARTSAVNAGRGAYKIAREVGEMIRETREMLISIIDARGQADVVLTPSVTIALNQIIVGQHWTSVSVAYVSPYEHNAVLRPIEQMRCKYGFKVMELPLTEQLEIDLEATEKMFSENPPTFVAMTAISNVTGYILPAKEVFRMAKKYKAYTLLDGAQAIGLIKMRFAELRADAVTFAGHKTLYGPFGAAGCYIKKGTDLDIVLSGGTGIKSDSLEMPRRIPDKLECGSKDSTAICGLHEAIKWIRMKDAYAMEKEVMDYLMAQLQTVKGIHIYGSNNPQKQAGVVSINIDGFTCGEVAAILDYKYDIAIRAGHHCAANIHKYLKDEPFKGTARISISVFTTKEDVDYLIEGLSYIDRDMLKDIDDNVLRGMC